MRSERKREAHVEEMFRRAIQAPALSPSARASRSTSKASRTSPSNKCTFNTCPQPEMEGRG